MSEFLYVLLQIVMWFFISFTSNILQIVNIVLEVIYLGSVALALNMRPAMTEARERRGRMDTYRIEGWVEGEDVVRHDADKEGNGIMEGVLENEDEDAAM